MFNNSNLFPNLKLPVLFNWFDKRLKVSIGFVLETGVDGGQKCICDFAFSVPVNVARAKCRFSSHMQQQTKRQHWSMQ